MDQPSSDDLLEAFEAPYVSAVSPVLAAAHLLAAGCDGPALRELAGLSEREFEAALELVPQAAGEAASVLEPARQRLLTVDDVPDGAEPAVVVVYASDVVGERIDVLATFVEHLSVVVRAAGMGEVDGLCDEAEDQVILCYSADPHRLRTFLESQVEASPIPPRRLEIRTSGRPAW